MKKHCVAKVLLTVSEIFLHENNNNYNSYRFSYRFVFILFLSFLTNQKQESGFQQVGSLVTRNISVFCLYRVALYFKAMPNSIEFYKGIFLHVIPVLIIVSWICIYFTTFWCLLLFWFILFLLTQFPLGICGNLILSVSLELRKVQLFDLAYKLTNWPLREMQNVDRIESDRTSNETDEAKNILNCNIRRFEIGILIIY